MPDDRSDHAPLSIAYEAILDPLTDAALTNAAKFAKAGVGRLSVFRVSMTGAVRFQVSGDNKTVVLLDTDEKGTRPVTIEFQIDGIPPGPTLG